MTNRIRWEPTEYGGWTGHVGIRDDAESHLAVITTTTTEAPPAGAAQQED